MDVVITYVNGADPEWQKQYAVCTKKEPSKRFRDWGMLPFQISCIRRNLPFVDRIFLVVSLPSQVPAELKGKVEVVLHRDIIPDKFLPTFNSITIEHYLHRIPGLSERFIYLNDDTIPVLPGVEEDFFDGERICRCFSKHLLAFGKFKKMTRNADALARLAAGKPAGLFFIRPQHAASPLFRDVCGKLCEQFRGVIEDSLTPTRQNKNISNYFYPDYLYYTGRVKRKRLSCRHFSMGVGTPEQLAEFLANPDRKWICINDVEMPQSRCDEFRAVIAKAAAK